ncbi:speckle-type POZ protein-like [Argiope bruennichi]|uniref:speckle-type POZ protein-like n=1 Tax=Argiope bruennichi TaxID=94029 RepID=UPI0024958015|nr:speckle-type POZ protein-like [Argiope bruennichi]
MYFSVDWEQRLYVSDVNSCYANFELMLDHEWSIICFLVRGTPYEPEIIDSIEIHRKNKNDGLFISGELKFTINGRQVWEKNFTEFIRPGYSFRKIGSIPNHYLSKNTECRLCGHVHIKDNGKKYANGESDKRFQLKSLEELSNDFKRLLDPETSCFSDVILKCGGASIAAHKNILSARSPVFAAMFSNPMKESHKNEVNFTDIEASVLQAMLVYMYTGKYGNLTASSAADLLFAADKYQLQDLKRICCDVLKDTASHQNVLKVLVLGDLHSDDLKTFATDYICKHHAKFALIETTEEWKSLQKERPGLVNDVLISLIHSMNKNLLG